MFFWDANVVKFLTLPQALMYLREEKKPGLFKHGIKFNSASEMLAWAAKQRSNKGAE